MQLPPGKKIYFLSDFHLGAPNYEQSLVREKKIVQFLDEVKQNAAVIFIVGDMFDFWYEYRTVVPKGYVRLLGKLAELTDAGIPIHFFVGNHDMWMNDYLQKELNRGNWGYVPNQNGGFMGYWWAFQKNEFCTQYLQIQEEDLVLKINSNKEENDKKFRNICYKHYLAKAKEDGLSFEKPTRFGKGETMTILTTKYLIRDESSELIDIESTLEKLKRYTQFIETNSLSHAQFVD